MNCSDKLGPCNYRNFSKKVYMPVPRETQLSSRPQQKLYSTHNIVTENWCHISVVKLNDIFLDVIHGTKILNETWDFILHQWSCFDTAYEIYSHVCCCWVCFSTIQAAACWPCHITSTTIAESNPTWGSDHYKLTNLTVPWAVGRRAQCGTFYP